MSLDSDSVSRQDALAMLTIGNVGPCFVGMQNHLSPGDCQPCDLSGIFLRDFAADSGLENMNV